MTEADDHRRDHRRDDRRDDRDDADAGWLRDLSRAAACLTVLWHTRAAGADPAGSAASARAYPVIGVGLGVVAAAAYGIGDGLGFYGLGSAALALALVAALTGARGETGAAAFMARLFGAEAEERTAVHAGLILVVFGIALRLGLVAAVSFAGAAAAILVAAVAVSRIAMPLAAGWGGQAAPAATDDEDEAGWGRRLWVVALVGVLLLILFLGLWGAVVAAVLGVGAAIALLAAAGRTGAPDAAGRDRARRDGGRLDGPSLWAVQQGVEIAILAGAVATL